MAGRGPGLSWTRAAQRAAQALLRVAASAEPRALKTAIAFKLVIAALPVLLGVLIPLVLIVGVLGASAGAASSKRGACGTQAASGPLDGPPAELIPLYRAASAENGLDPDGGAVLAAINRVETDFGKNLNTSSAGAIGWMQFMPSTWARYGAGGDPYSPHDAIFAAARYLRANGAPQSWYPAIFAYNHADWYVQEVLGIARQYGGASIAAGAGPGSPVAPPGSPPTGEDASSNACGGSGSPLVDGERAQLLEDGRVAAPAGAPAAVQQIIAAGNQIAGLPYVWGGHHDPGSPTDGYDCSSAVSYVLFSAGLLGTGNAGVSNGQFWTGLVAASFLPGGGAPGLESGAGQWVTIYASSSHVFMEVAGVRFDDSSVEQRNGRGPAGGNVSMWQPSFGRPLNGFSASHPTGL